MVEAPEGVRRGRRPKLATKDFLTVYLGSHPGSFGREIVATGREDGFSRSSIYRSLRALVQKGDARKVGRRYWLGPIDDPDLRIVAEVERALAVLRSKELGSEAKAEAARQLSRESSRAPLTSRNVVEILTFGAAMPRDVQRALLPFVQRALRAAIAPPPPKKASTKTPPRAREKSVGRPYPRRVWEAAAHIIEEFLADAGGDGNLAWNAAYEAVREPGLLGDTQLLRLARLAVAVECRAPLDSPSPARAVFRKIIERDRLRETLRVELFRLMSAATGDQERARTQEIIRELDLAPRFDPRK